MKRYAIRQKLTVFANKYEIFEIDDAGERLAAFAQQKRFAIKERITFYTDESKTTVLFEVKARNVLELAAKYDVFDGQGVTIGVVGKAFAQSLVTSTWHVFTPGDETAPKLIVEESNIGVAILRRIWEFLPIVSSVPFFIKYHFDFKRETGGEVVATYRKTALVRDHYELAVLDETLLSEHDWRTLAAVGVMLDALQSR